MEKLVAEREAARLADELEQTASHLEIEVDDQIGTHVGGAGTLRGRDGGEAAGQVLTLYP